MGNAFLQIILRNVAVIILSYGHIDFGKNLIHILTLCHRTHTAVKNAYGSGIGNDYGKRGDNSCY